MNIKNRQQFLVMLVIGAAALFVGVNFVFTPLQSWWRTRQDEVNKLRGMVSEGNQLIKRDQILRDHWRNMVDNALPPSAPDAEQQFLKGLNGWARESGTEITSIMPQWKSDSTNYMTLDCRVESSGELGALCRFMYNIEKGPMAVRLDSVELSSHDNNGQQMTLGLEINGLSLLQNNKK